METNPSEIMTPCIEPGDCLIRDLEEKITGIDTEKASNMLLEMYRIIHFVENSQTFIYPTFRSKVQLSQ